MQQKNQASPDAPVQRDEDDRYGFTAIADGLAESILAINGDGGTVMGIEGRWGAGKTSLLNLLLARLESSSPPGTHVLRFSPWLNGAGSLAEALLLPVADIIRKEEEQREPIPQGIPQHARRKGRQAWRWITRKKNEGTMLEVLSYLQQTSGRLAPLADFAGNFVPGLSLASKGMDTLAKTDLSARRKTAAELRDSIESRLGQLGLTFIIVIDDLDRLEPSQAVEVLRLVRSVADFSRFRYVMCYDRDVLAHAVEHGLHVQNGRIYLQKIVPLSFSLPRPESFTLQRHFRNEALQVFREVNGCEADAEILAGLSQVTDIYGEPLSTPREVSQAVSAIRFRYPRIREYVWFPDLCLLQLLKIVNPALHDWIEHYLSERAIVASGDAGVSADERQAMSASLSGALALFSTHAARSVWTLAKWLPGIQGQHKSDAAVFTTEDPHRNETASVKRRLASPVYWRYYFALSAPGNVLSEKDVKEIIRLAGNDQGGLTQRLLESVTDNGVSSRTWYEHILTRLTPEVTNQAGQRAQRGLLAFLFNHADEILRLYRHRGLFFRDRLVGMEELTTQLIVQMLADDRPETLGYLQHLLDNAQAVGWVADYMRDLLWLHGAAGDRAGSESEMFLSGDELEQLRQLLADRMQQPKLREHVLDMDDAGKYLWAWRDIAGVETLKHWSEEKCREDAAFLRLLLSLRTPVSSSNRGEYLKLDLVRAEQLTESGKQFKVRLDEIIARNDPELSELLKKVHEAISNSRRF